MTRGSRRGCIALKKAILGIDDEEESTFTIHVDGRTFHFQGDYVHTHTYTHTYNHAPPSCYSQHRMLRNVSAGSRHLTPLYAVYSSQ